MRRSLSPDSGEHPTQYAQGKERDFPIGSCSRCGKSDHRSPDCPFRVPLSVLSEAWPFGSSLFEPVRPISKYQIGTVKATERFLDFSSQFSSRGAVYV